MIKKISLVLLLFFIIISCGKKGNPKYKDLKRETKIQSIIVNKV